MNDTALLTDLYELHMVQSCHALGMQDRAVFDFIVRALPEGRNFLVAAGLAQVLDYLEEPRFTDDDLAWLAGTAKKVWRRHDDGGGVRHSPGLPRLSAEVDRAPS